VINVMLDILAPLVSNVQLVSEVFVTAPMLEKELVLVILATQVFCVINVMSDFGDQLVRNVTVSIIVHVIQLPEIVFVILATQVLCVINVM